LFRPVTSGVSVFLDFVAKGHQTMQHVSSSPSKIPYVGFSPVRLQTGIRPRPSQTKSGLSARPAFTHPIPAYTWSKLSSQKDDSPQLNSRFFRRRGKAQADHPSILMQAIQSRGPWLARWLCCPSGSLLTMASSETLGPPHRLMNYTMGPVPYGLVWTGTERLPNFLRVSFPYVPPYVPRRTERLHLSVASSLILAFALFAQARHPQSHHAGSKVGRVTGLQGSLNATARTDCSPCTGKDFYFRAFTLLSHLRGASGITMRANRQFPQPDLHRPDTRPYGLRAKTRRKKQTIG
jgi:hypothetical protein